MVDLFSGENIRFAATDDTFELLVCDVDNSTSAISDFIQSLHLRHPWWTASILQEEVLHPVFFFGGGIVGKRMCQRSKVRTLGNDQRGCSSLRNTRLQTRVRIDRTQLSILPTSFLLRFYSTATERLLVKLWQPFRLCSSIIQLSSCLSADILMHQTEQRRGSFTAAGRALIGHGNVGKPCRKSMAEGRNSRKRLWEQLCFTAEEWVKIRACRSIRRIWAAVWWGWIHLFKSL